MMLLMFILAASFPAFAPVLKPSNTNAPLYAIVIVGDSYASGTIYDTQALPVPPYNTYTNNNVFMYRGGLDICTNNVLTNVYAFCRFGAPLGLATALESKYGASNSVIVVVGNPGASIYTDGPAVVSRVASAVNAVASLTSRPVRTVGGLFLYGANDAQDATQAAGIVASYNRTFSDLDSYLGTNVFWSIVMTPINVTRTYVPTVRTNQFTFIAQKSRYGTNDIGSPILLSDGAQPTNEVAFATNAVSFFQAKGVL